MSEQKKIDEIKEDLNEVADEVWEKDVFDVITNQDGKIIAEVFDKDAAQLFAKSNKYITYLLQEIERLQGEVVFWKEAAENQQQNNFRFMAEIERKVEALKQAQKELADITKDRDLWRSNSTY